MSKIEWTGKTWNPVVGCSRVSDGCKNCYAEPMTKRLALMGNEKYQGLLNDQNRFNGVLRFDENALLKPLSIKKPTTFFVNSMSDLFHENVEDEWIDKVFAVMALCPQHTFQILTKRANRMRDYTNNTETRFRIAHEIREFHNLLENDDVGNAACRTMELQDKGVVAESEEGNLYLKLFPLPNVHHGVSVENQKAADERILLLLETLAAVRFLSCEPLLEEVIFQIPINIYRWLNPLKGHYHDGAEERIFESANKIDWIIVGGESGGGARPCALEWIQSIVFQGRDSGTPVFVKQLGAFPVAENCNYWDFPENVKYLDYGDKAASARFKLKNKKGANMSEFPEDLRVRQLPK